MQVVSTNSANPVLWPNDISRAELSTWKRVWEDLPEPGSLVPVWDGQYMYYAVYWIQDGAPFWIISNHMEVNPEDSHLREHLGEQIFPTHWMKMQAPI